MHKDGTGATVNRVSGTPEKRFVLQPENEIFRKSAMLAVPMPR